METRTALDALNALAHETRLSAFRTLVQAGPEGLSVGELRDVLAVPPATLTAHLNVLRAAGLVGDEREGRGDPRPRRLCAHGGVARLPHRKLLRRRRELRPCVLLLPEKERHPPMSRFHVHLNVADVQASTRFYSELFGVAPTVLKDDYAKWMLEDPRVNFAISNTGRAPGIDHLGIQVDSDTALALLGRRLDAAGGTVVPEDAAVCCYAKSDKLWTEDPQGLRWESFHTTGEAPTYYAGASACATDGASCSPDIASVGHRVADGDSCCAPASGCCVAA